MKRRNLFLNSFYNAALLSSTLFCSASVFASGFQIQEQNVTNLGTAYSGTAALAADASTNFYNAAGLTHVQNTQLVFSTVGINGEFDLHPTYASAFAPANTPITPLEPENAGGFNFVPSFHMAHPLTPNVVLGLSVTPTFGLKTEYSDNSVARYVATRSDLKTILISPSIAYRFNPQWSFAIGADAQYANAKLDSSIGTNNVAGPDGFSKNEGDDWGYSWHAGVLFEFNECTRVGLSYRGEFNYDVEGTNQLVRPVILLGTALPIERVVQTKITLPETAILSAYHEFENNWAIMADVHWTAWHRFKTLRLHYPPSTNDVVVNEEWSDTWRVALGTHYQSPKNWTLRAGVAYDKTPVDDQHRTARIPDEDRVWLAVGFGYTFTKNIHVDAGYAHLFFKDAQIDDRGPATSSATFQQLTGKYKSKADIFGVQLRIDFV